jgi:hypothetical protein
MRPAHGTALADIRAHVRHGLTTRHPRPWHLCADVGRGVQNGVPPAAGLVDILRLKRYPHAAGRLVGVVDRVMAPPGAVVVPDVVVGVRTMCVHAPHINRGGGTSAVLGQKKI